MGGAARRLTRVEVRQKRQKRQKVRRPGTAAHLGIGQYPAERPALLAWPLEGGDEMKAAVWHQKRDVRIDSTDEPGTLGADEALLEVALCGICGTDVHEYTD